MEPTHKDLNKLFFLFFFSRKEEQTRKYQQPREKQMAPIDLHEQ
uniref:Uncharacterized protein n=1 Tax=Arundo donax TaxID=35708 RepID=A0A0A9E407_ARUDO